MDEYISPVGDRLWDKVIELDRQAASLEHHANDLKAQSLDARARNLNDVSDDLEAQQVEALAMAVKSRTASDKAYLDFLVG